MGECMRAVVLHGPHQMRLEEVPRPAPRPDQVLVRVRYSACCATDFDLIDGTMPDQAKYLIILGHEWSGEVVEAPPGYAHLVGKDVVECSGSSKAFAQVYEVARHGTGGAVKVVLEI